GKVTDENNSPLEGASVRLESATKGTASDANGHFTIIVPESADSLVFSMVGYTEKKMAIPGGTILNVVLQNEAAGLNEVVDVGYGTQKKVNLTASVATISSDQIERRPNVSTSNALQGLAPGVTVTSQTGSPGRDAGQIRIRGINS